MRNDEPRIICQASKTEHRILEALQRASGPLEVAKLAELCGTHKAYAQDRLALMLASGTVERRKAWRMNRPYEYQITGRTWPDDSAEREAYERYIASRDRASSKARKSAARRAKQRVSARLVMQ